MRRLILFALAAFAFAAVPSTAQPQPPPVEKKADADPKEPLAAEAAADAPKHGGLFYRTVRNRAETKLAAELVAKRGYKKADARAAAKAMIDDLDERSIDAYAAHVGVKQGIGDGGFLKWLSEHREEILALIEFIVKLLMTFADPPPHVSLFGHFDYPLDVLIDRDGMPSPVEYPLAC